MESPLLRLRAPGDAAPCPRSPAPGRAPTRLSFRHPSLSIPARAGGSQRPHWIRPRHFRSAGRRTGRTAGHGTKGCIPDMGRLPHNRCPHIPRGLPNHERRRGKQHRSGHGRPRSLTHLGGHSHLDARDVARKHGGNPRLGPRTHGDARPRRCPIASRGTRPSTRIPDHHRHARDGDGRPRRLALVHRASLQPGSDDAHITRMWRAIHAANSHAIPNPSLIYPGQTLTIPQDMP